MQFLTYRLKKHFSPTLPKRPYRPNPSFDCFPTLITYKLDFDLDVLRFWAYSPRQFLRYQRLKSVTARSRRSTSQVVQYVCKYIINFLRLTSIVIIDRPDVDLQSSVDVVMDLHSLDSRTNKILENLLVIYHTRFPDQRVRYHDGDITRNMRQFKSVGIPSPTCVCGFMKIFCSRVDSIRGPSKPSLGSTSRP